MNRPYDGAIYFVRSRGRLCCRRIARRVEDAAPYKVAVYFYGFGIRQPSPFGEGGGEADG